MVKGKKGLTFEQIVGIVILLITATLIIMAISGFFGDIRALFGFIPNDLPKKAEFCQRLGNDKVSYCDFSKADVEGKGTIYVNCAYAEDSNFRESIDEAVGSPPTCAKNSEIEFCNQIRQGDNFKATKVNSLDCPVISGVNCGGQEGTLKKSCLDSESNIGISITDPIERKLIDSYNYLCCTSAE